MNKQIATFLAAAQRLKADGLVQNGVNKGSMSCKVSPDSFLVSPSGISYEQLSEETVNLMRTDGSFVQQNAAVSRDGYFHLGIYRARQDVQAIIHTHSKYATALALASKRLPLITYGMKIHCGGPVELAPFALPNSEECNQSIVSYLADRNAVLLENHGLVCVGESLETCYETTEFVESLCESYVHAVLIGQVKELELGKENVYG